MKRLQDRIALVTGSSSGIGAAVAKCMAGGMTLYPGFATVG